MKKKSDSDRKKESLLKESEKLGFGRICLYILIFSICAVAMIFNLNMQGVGMRTLTDGTDPERKLLLLTFAVVVVCLAAIVILIVVFVRKKFPDKMQEESIRGWKTSNNHKKG